MARATGHLLVSVRVGGAQAGAGSGGKAAAYLIGAVLARLQGLSHCAWGGGVEGRAGLGTLGGGVYPVALPYVALQAGELCVLD